MNLLGSFASEYFSAAALRKHCAFECERVANICSMQCIWLDKHIIENMPLYNIIQRDAEHQLSQLYVRYRPSIGPTGLREPVSTACVWILNSRTTSVWDDALYYIFLHRTSIKSISTTHEPMKLQFPCHFHPNK